MSDILVRPYNKLGGENLGWLNSKHHFSFAEYHDPRWMNWGTLRVWTDGLIKPKGGFPLHPHRNIDIITYMLPENYNPVTGKMEGGAGITHRDSLGSEGTLRPGDIQVMSIGQDGVMHSEVHSDPQSGQSANAFQIWIMQTERRQKSTWDERHFPRRGGSNSFVVLASGLKEDKDAFSLASPTRLVGGTVEQGKTANYHIGQNRLAYLVSVGGTITVNGQKLGPHDGAAIKNTTDLEITSLEGNAEVVIVDTIPVN